MRLCGVAQGHPARRGVTHLLLSGPRWPIREFCLVPFWAGQTDMGPSLSDHPGGNVGVGGWGCMVPLCLSWLHMLTSWSGCRERRQSMPLGTGLTPACSDGSWPCVGRMFSTRGGEPGPAPVPLVTSPPRVWGGPWRAGGSHSIHAVGSIEPTPAPGVLPCVSGSEEAASVAVGCLLTLGLLGPARA